MGTDSSNPEGKPLIRYGKLKRKTAQCDFNFQELVVVAQQLTPTLIEITKKVQGSDQISDDEFVRWGKALESNGRPFAKSVVLIFTFCR